MGLRAATNSMPMMTSHISLSDLSTRLVLHCFHHASTYHSCWDCPHLLNAPLLLRLLAAEGYNMTSPTSHHSQVNPTQPAFNSMSMSCTLQWYNPCCCCCRCLLRRAAALLPCMTAGCSSPRSAGRLAPQTAEGPGPHCGPACAPTPQQHRCAAGLSAGNYCQ
jgi:hypothetical protein